MSLKNLWESHFEAGYRDDLEYAKALIADGEKSPHRILHKLNHRMRIMDRLSEFPLMPGTTDQYDTSKCTMNWTDKTFKGRRGLLPTGVDTFVQSSIMGQDILLPFYNETGTAPGYFLSDLIKDQFDCVVDLGCGNGSALFDLYRFGCDLSIKYWGGEYSEIAVELINVLSGLQNDFDLKAHRFDFKEPDLSFVKDSQSVLYYTVRAVQVIDLIPKDFFYALLDSAPQVHCVHFEPIGFQIDAPMTRINVEQRDIFQEKNWNGNLMNVLNELQDEGKIEVSYVGKDVLFGGERLIPNSIIEWKKI